MINSMAELQELVLQGEQNWKQYGNVKAIVWTNLILFNYTAKAQIEGRWNWFERNSRGLILNNITGEVVAWPFEKFMNYGQALPNPSAKLGDITAKLDGNLGICFYNNWTDDWQVATRGSFTGEQAQWATKRLCYYDLDGVDTDLTLLLEIIYPENRIVVDYGELKELFLLGARNRLTGKELDAGALDSLARYCNFNRPQRYTFDTVEDVLVAAKVLSYNEEGWVLRYSDNSRFKVKGDAYLVAHRLVKQVNFKHVLAAHEAGTLDTMLEGVPDEFLEAVHYWRNEIDYHLHLYQSNCRSHLRGAPEGTQKEFALWVQENFTQPVQGFMFMTQAGKDITPAVYKYLRDHPIPLSDELQRKSFRYIKDEV